MSRLIPRVLTPADLPLAELHAARLDGEVFSIDEFFSPLDEVPDLRLRGDALFALAGRGAVAELESAVWLYGLVMDPPLVHTVTVDRTHRITLPRTRRLRVRETRIFTDDIHRIGAMSVTSPVRTIFDILMAKDFTEVSRRHITSLLSKAGADLTKCRSRINAIPNMPGRHEALARLNSLGHPELTRYTS